MLAFLPSCQCTCTPLEPPTHPPPHPTRHVTQALQFLALERKGELSLDDISQELCPTLSHQQLYRLCTTAWDDGPSAGERLPGGGGGLGLVVLGGMACRGKGEEGSNGVPGR